MESQKYLITLKEIKKREKLNQGHMRQIEKLKNRNLSPTVSIIT